MPKNSEVKYAGFWVRFGARLLDILILELPIALIGVGLTALTQSQFWYYLIQLAMISLIVWMDGTKGGTPGKLIIGLKIVNEKGQFIGVPRAILRYVCKIVSGLILGIGYFVIGWTAKKQGLHDMIASTFVVRK